MRQARRALFATPLFSLDVKNVTDEGFLMIGTDVEKLCPDEIFFLFRPS